MTATALRRAPATRARAPRTQAQRRDETRAALLDAAVASLVAGGFARTTTLEVQRRAGVSRGALLHHFPSKAELLVATIAHLAEMRGRDLRQRAASLPTGPARIEAVLDLLWECFAGPLFQVSLELRAAARTDAELRAPLVSAERAVHERILHQAAALFGPEVAGRPGFAAAMDLTLHLMMGAAMTTLTHSDEPRVATRIHQWKTLFPTLLEKIP
ncbi:MAG: TetR family transcriptional regulator [Kofleriaceae bacterium]|nr:TetR family transcriptional regulator [Kofleriaceae bacterium]MCL4228742.1 TetR family transcriptional regulator [Myxococcales bacterium]